MVRARCVFPPTFTAQLKLGEMTSTIPTLGFNVETVAYKNIEFMVWDMGGQDKIRQLWRHYYEGCQVGDHTSAWSVASRR